MPLWARRMGECSCDAKLDILDLAQTHWDKFPCPPPWKSHLLFKVNWSGKLGTPLGNSMMLRMAHRCNIQIPVNYQQLVTEPSSCGLKCQLLIVIVSCVFLLIMAVIVMAICYKRRSKNKLDSPNRQIALGPYRYYDTCKSYNGNGALPMVRQSETIVIGNTAKTRMIDHESLYNTYIEENLHPENVRLATERQMCLPLNGTFKPVIEHELITPSTSSSVDKSPIYECIDGEDENASEHYHYPYQRGTTLNYQGCHRCSGDTTPYNSIGSRSSRKRLEIHVPASRSRTPLDSDCSVSSQRRRKKQQPRCESAGARGDSSSYSDHTELSSLSNSDGSSGRYSAPLTNGSFYTSHVVPGHVR